MKKRSVKGGMRVNAYHVLARAVEEGVGYGWRRAHKHTDKPAEDQVQDQISEAVIGAICEWFEFDETSHQR